MFEFINNISLFNNIDLNNLGLLEKGGPVMFILLGFSIFAFAIFSRTVSKTSFENSLIFF